MTTQPPRMGFWEFCHQHTVAMVFAVLFIIMAAVQVAQAVTGNWQPYDGFWKYNGSCK